MDADGPNALPAPDRPVDPTPRHTADLPATPTRDRTIPATAWIEAPATLLALGDELGGPRGHEPGAVAGHAASFLRRVGPWLLWRAGPPRGGDACHWAAHEDDLARQHTFRLRPDGTGEGVGPSGAVSTTFRSWKEDLRDHD
ncbi:MAG: hypothetical protein KF906_07500 [Actinobacteria bacterium]|nr:hypothetical protein [Actinomycetota bacterium]